MLSERAERTGPEVRRAATGFAHGMSRQAYARAGPGASAVPTISATSGEQRAHGDAARGAVHS